MNIIYLSNRSLAASLPTLTFGEIRKMLPVIRDEDSIPRPELLKDNCHNRFLEVAEENFSVRVYCDGPVSGGRRAVLLRGFSVRRAGVPSVSDDYAETVQSDEMHWLLPLAVTGQERVFHNKVSEEGYHTLHFEAGLPTELTPHVPNFVVEASAEEVEEAERASYRRRLHGQSPSRGHQ